MNMKIQAIYLPLSHPKLMANFMADNSACDAQIYFDMEPLRDMKAFENMAT
jgi:hypothetical protein